MWTPFNEEHKPIFVDPRPLPDRLYRYRSVRPDTLQRLVEFELIEEGIFLSGLGDLNDPDEGRFLVMFGGDHAQIENYFRRVIPRTDKTTYQNEIEQMATRRAGEILALSGLPPPHVLEFTRSALEKVIRVACFSTHPINYSMWANYAKYVDENGHSLDGAGICVEYAVDESWRALNLGAVKYSEEIPVVDMLAENRELQLAHALLSKASEWRCENEWRIFFVIQSMPPFPTDLTTNSRVQVKGGVVGVIFGLRTPDSLERTIREKLDQAGRKLILKRVVRDPVTFERKTAVLT